MKRIGVLLFFLALSLIQQNGNAESNPEFPQWINALGADTMKTLQTKVSVSSVKLPDALEEERLFTFCLKGHGSLKNIPDPFKALERMFFKNNWKYVPRYQADGHGRSSFAYEKENHFCNIQVNTDSSCDDEETGYVPSQFWFEINC
jgi:hypothetical protein